MSNNLEADYSNYVVYGPDANCTLALCPPELSVYQYRPSLAANVCFLLFFAIAGLIHLVIGLKWRSWFFVVCMSCGCICEIVGYGGRLWLWQNPFSFQGFLMQISKFLERQNSAPTMYMRPEKLIASSLHHFRPDLVHRSHLHHPL